MSPFFAHPDERKLIEKEAPALAAAKGISIEEATRQMTVAFSYYTDADWQKTIGANESVDPTALEYLAKALTPIANRYDIPDSRGDVPLVGDRTYSSADTQRLLQNYQNTHGDFYDPTVNGEYLNGWTIAGNDQRDFLQRNLNYGSYYDGFVNGGLGSAAGIGQGVGSTFGGLVSGAIGLVTRPEQTINGALGSIPTITEAFHNSTINSAQNFIYTLQGNSYESMRNQMQSSTELGLSLVGGEAGLAGRGASFGERAAWKLPIYSVSDEMHANPYHVDWQSYAGGEAGAVGADTTKVGDGVSSSNSSAHGRADATDAKNLSYSPIVEGGGLQAYENAGGHLIERHVDLSDADLAQRLGSSNISSASRFFDRSTAESAVSAAIDANQSAIQNYLNGNAKGYLAIDYMSSSPVGVTLLRGASSTTSASGVRVVIARDPSMPTGYRIVTGYPH